MKIPTIPADEYLLRTHALTYQQGDRQLYQCNLTLKQIEDILPDRRRDGEYELKIEGTNRGLNRNHAAGICQYMQDDPHKWMLGPMQITVNPDKIEVYPHLDDDGKETGMVELRIRNTHKRAIGIVDGQHRRRAVSDLLAILEAPTDQPHKASVQALAEQSIPVCIIPENDVAALRQIFVDFAKAKPIEGNTTAVFDARDAANLTAKWLAEESEVFKGFILNDRASIPPSSEFLLTINHLADCVRKSQVGFKGRWSREKNQHFKENPEVLQQLAMVWSDEFLPAAREEYADCKATKAGEINFFQHRQQSYAYRHQVLIFWAMLYHDWQAKEYDWKDLAQFLSTANLQRRDDDCLFVRHGMAETQPATLHSHQYYKRVALQGILKEAAEFNGLDPSVFR